VNRILVLRSQRLSAGETLTLDEGESHHLRVRRAEAGEAVQLLDGAGLMGSGRLIRSGKSWAVAIDRAEHRPRPAELTLAVAGGDRDRFAWLVEKAAELGVTRVVPLETERTTGVATRVRESHMEKLRRHALEATKQCGAAWAVSVEPPVPLGVWLERPRAAVEWLADATGSPPPAELGGEAVAVVVGPEGGFSEAERDAIARGGYPPIRLGPNTLRFETAALAAAMAVTAARLRGSHG
jgi:16S rRNA (uracil1498-N3)-methyltransferase